VSAAKRRARRESLPGETLSQREIDALLSSISIDTGTGTEALLSQADLQGHGEKCSAPAMAAAPKKVKIYDFRRPDKFAREQLRTIAKIHENFARTVTTSLSALLRAMIHVQVISVDQVTYEEFIRSVPNPTCISVFSVGGNLKGNAIIEMNLATAFTIIDRLFGGGGKGTQKSRALTAIEEPIIRKILTLMLENLAGAWSQVATMQPRVDVMESNPAFTQIVPPSDMALLVTFEMKVIDTEGVVNLCFPHMVLEPILERLSAQFFYTNTDRALSRENVTAIEQKLRSSKVPFIVELGRAAITIKDFLTLLVGDVVMLDKGMDDILDISAGEVLKFRGRPRLLANNKYGVLIDHVVSEEEVEAE
jgi:flagellar motor switch protein FliM